MGLLLSEGLPISGGALYFRDLLATINLDFTFWRVVTFGSLRYGDPKINID